MKKKEKGFPAEGGCDCKGVRYRKGVQHFLMEAVGGNVANHDEEYDRVEWVPLDEAIQRLTHENEAEIVRRAGDLLTGG